MHLMHKTVQIDLLGLVAADYCCRFCLLPQLLSVGLGR